MRKITNTNEQTLLKSCNEIYGLDAARASVLRDGSDNIIWTLEIKNGKKYVARMSKRELGGDIAFEAEWLKVLLTDGVPVVPIIETKDKKRVPASPAKINTKYKIGDRIIITGYRGKDDIIELKFLFPLR